MNEANSGAIEERLARLERGVKLCKRAATATMVLLVSLIVWSVATSSGRVWLGGSGARDLMAKSLTIVDEKGTPRVYLATTKDGPRLRLNDEKATPRVVVGVNKDGPGVLLNDEKGVPHVSLAVNKDGPGVVLDDEKGTPRAYVQVTKDGPGVTIDDEKGTARICLKVLKNGPSVVLYDEERQPRAVLGSTPLERVRTGATETTAPSSLTLFDKEGKVIWKAP
jgi:hypothetical protein